jgi:hypothetical protein
LPHPVFLNEEEEKLIQKYSHERALTPYLSPGLYNKGMTF